MSDSIRDTLSAAFDEAEKASTETVVDVEPRAIDETPPGNEQAPPEGTDTPPVDTPADGAPAPTDAPPPDVAPPPAADTPPQGDASPEVPPADTKDPTVKPPGSWTPAAREEWAKVPAAVKQEVWKREREASRALTASTEARKLQQDFSQTIQPYLGFIAAEGSTPMKAVDQMMRTAAVLRVGTADQKVQLVAQTIKQFGVNLEALDAALAGVAAPPADPSTLVQQQVQQALAPFLNERRAQAQQAQQAVQQQAQSELEAFASDPKNEFYDDVAPLMADIIEVASRNGQQMGLTEAYQRATLLHEPVRRVIDARKSREAATQASAAARKARGAAVSVTPSTQAAVVPAQGGNNLRADIEAAFAQTQGR
jgi:hypothetical protein